MSSMQLFRLDNGHVSLEFAADQRAVVLGQLQRHGAFSAERQADLEVITVAGNSFVLTDDWDEMALISTSRLGDRMLRRIAREAVAHESGVIGDDAIAPAPERKTFAQR